MGLLAVIGPSMKDKIGALSRSSRSLWKARFSSQKLRIWCSCWMKSIWLGTGSNTGGFPRLEFHDQTFIDLALALVVHDADRTHFPRVGDVGATVRLQIQPHDLDHPDLLDSLRQQVDLGSDQVWNLEGLLAGQDVGPHRPPGFHLAVDLLFDLAHQFGAHALELEVHSPPQRLHVAPGDAGAVVAPDHPAQDVHGRVGAHEPKSAAPIEFAADAEINRRR